MIRWVLVVLINAVLAHLKHKGLLLRSQTAQDMDAFAQHGEGHWRLKRRVIEN